MTNKEIFKIWSPEGVKWVDWARPVPFIAINENLKTREFFDFSIPDIRYLNEVHEDTAVIVDMPNYESVMHGLALAKIGYRPIPLYNGTDEQEGAKATVNNQTIDLALVWGALEIAKLNLKKDAPPVFLLDSNRMHRYKAEISLFDNSWDIYDQDMPSAEYFLDNGITKIIVSSRSINKDLNKILYKFKKKGLTILFTNGYDEVEEVVLKKPSKKDK